MRNASIASFAGFLGLSLILTPFYLNQGLWVSFVGYVVLRAACLGVQMPALRGTIGNRAEGAKI